MERLNLAFLSCEIPTLLTEVYLRGASPSWEGGTVGRISPAPPLLAPSSLSAFILSQLVVELNPEMKQVQQGSDCGNNG